MKPVIPTKFLVAAIVVFVCAGAWISFPTGQSTASQGGDEKTAKLERQIEGLQNSVSTLSKMVADGHFRPDAVAVVNSSNAATNDNRPKKLGSILDVWLMDGKGSEPPTTPSLYTTVNKSEPFQFGKMLDDPDLLPYKGKPLGLLWRGRLHIEKEGSHLLIMEFAIGDKRVSNCSPGAPWQAELTIAGNAVYSHEIVSGWNTNSSYPTTTVLDLQPGYHDFRFWVSPKIWMTDYDYSTLSLTLKLKEPGATAPVVIGADRISHEER